jgi:hypothetical protein
MVTKNAIGYVGDWCKSSAPLWVKVFFGGWWSESKDCSHLKQGSGEKVFQRGSRVQ